MDFSSRSQTEAAFLRTTTSSDAFSPSAAAPPAPPTHNYAPKCSKRPRSSSSQSDEPGAKARRGGASEQDSVPSSSLPDDGPALVTPPYSPASLGSPLQQDELHPDLLLPGYTDQLLSSPGSYSYPETALTCYLSPCDPLPVAAQAPFDQAAFNALLSPVSPPSSPAYDFPACTSDARLVPDCFSASDVCEPPVDCALHQDDFSLLEQPPGGSVHQVHHVPQHVPPTRSALLAPAPTSVYNEREQAEISVLAQQIFSLASSFDMCHSLGPRDPADSLPPACHPPLKRDLVLDDGVFDSILKDLDRVTGKSLQQDSACAFSPPFASVGRHDQNPQVASTPPAHGEEPSARSFLPNVLWT